MIKSVLFCVAIGLLAVNAQAKNGFYPTKFSNNAHVQVMPAGSSPLLYYGGPVISHAEVVTVYWGNSVKADTVAGMDGFFKAVLDSTYMDWLEEYNTYIDAVGGTKGTQQHVGRGKYMGAVTITPANTKTKIDDVEIQAEIQHQVAIGALPKADDNTLYMLYFPAGITITASGATSCKEFCAYHGFSGEPGKDHFFYGVHPDIGGFCSFGCSAAQGHFNSVTAITAHEMIEAITDPYPTPGSTPAYPQAWNRADGYEIGDICQGHNNMVAAGTTTYTVQSEYDNSTEACTAVNYKNP